MTIKQQGGIFGRNPTFNTVTVDDKLGIGSEADVALKVSNGLSGYTWTPNARTAAIIEGGFAGGTSFSIISKTATSSNIYLGDTDAENMGIIQQNHSTNTLSFGSAQALTTRLDGSGNFNLLSGNLVIGTSGKGIDFSATSGTGTSELFDDYEEGTWTPTLEGLSGGSLVFSTIGHARYTKVGRVVSCSAFLSGGDFSTHTASGSLVIKGLPFSATSVATGVLTATYSNLFTSDEADVTISGYTESTLIRLLKGSSLAAYTGADLNSAGTSGAIVLSIVYDTGA